MKGGSFRYLKKRGLSSDRGAHSRADDILSRAVIFSVGVVDVGLGAGFGIQIDSSDAEADPMGEDR